MAQNSTLDQLTNAILQGEAKGRSDVLSLEAFKQLYRHLDKVARDRGQHIDPVEIVILTEQALICFASAPDFRILVGGHKKTLAPKDFEIVMNARFRGNLRPVTAPAFIWTELRQNGLILLIIGCVFFYVSGFDRDLSSISLLNQMLVEANALFIGIFVLFTVSQNRDRLAMPELAWRGQTHQLMQNDKYVVWMAIFSLLLAFFSTAVAGADFTSPASPIANAGWIVDTGTVSRVLTLVAILLLIDCFLSITRYYLRIMTSMVEATMVKNISANRGTSSDKTDDSR